MAITEVQQQNDTLRTTTSYTTTYGATPTDGNLLVGVWCTGTGGSNPGTITNPTGWSTAFTLQRSTGQRVICCYKVASSDGTSVNIKSTGNVGWIGTIFEFSGLDTSSPLDVTQTNDGGSGGVTSLASGTTAATAVADSLVIAGWGLANTSGGSESVDVGAIQDTSNDKVIIATRVISSTGTQAITASWTTSRTCVAGIAVFKGGATDVNVSLTPVAVTLGLPAPVTSGDAAVGPAPVAVALGLPAPATTGSAGIAGTPVALPLGLPGPTVRGDAAVAGAPVTLPLGLPAPSISGGATALPAPIVLPIGLPPPNVTGTSGGDVNVSLTPVALPLGLPGPVVAGGSAVSPAPVALPLGLPAPTESGGATVLGSPVSLPLGLPSTVVSASATVGLVPIPLTVGLPAPTETGSAVAAPAPVALRLGLPAPGVTGSAAVAILPVVLSITIPDVAVGEPFTLGGLGPGFGGVVNAPAIGSAVVLSAAGATGSGVPLGGVTGSGPSGSVSRP